MVSIQVLAKNIVLIKKFKLCFLSLFACVSVGYPKPLNFQIAQLRVLQRAFSSQPERVWIEHASISSNYETWKASVR